MEEHGPKLLNPQKKTLVKISLNVRNSLGSAKHDCIFCKETKSVHSKLFENLTKKTKHGIDIEEVKVIHCK